MSVDVSFYCFCYLNFFFLYRVSTGLPKLRQEVLWMPSHGLSKLCLQGYIRLRPLQSISISPKNSLLAKVLTRLSFMYTERTGRQEGNVGQYLAVGEVYHLRRGVRSLGILSVAPDKIHGLYVAECRSQWPRGLTRRSVAARLLRLLVRIPPGARMFVCCECCVLSGNVSATN